MKSICVFYVFFLNPLAVCFTDGQVSNSEANQADANMSAAKPSEQRREDSNIGRPIQDVSAATPIKSQADPEEDDLLEGMQFFCVFGRVFIRTLKYTHCLSSCFLFQMRRTCVLR